MPESIGVSIQNQHVASIPVATRAESLKIQRELPTLPSHRNATHTERVIEAAGITDRSKTVNSN